MLAGPAALGTVSLFHTPATAATLLMPGTTASGIMAGPVLWEGLAVDLSLQRGPLPSHSCPEKVLIEPLVLPAGEESRALKYQPLV